MASNIWIVQGPDLWTLASTLGNTGVHRTVRIAAPHGDGIAVKVDEDMWSRPLGRRERPLAPMLMVGGRPMWEITPTLTPMEGQPTHDLSMAHNAVQSTTLPVYERDLIALRDLLNRTYPE